MVTRLRRAMLKQRSFGSIGLERGYRAFAFGLGLGPAYGIAIGTIVACSISPTDWIVGAAFGLIGALMLVPLLIIPFAMGTLQLRDLNIAALVAAVIGVLLGPLGPVPTFVSSCLTLFTVLIGRLCCRDRNP